MFVGGGLSRVGNTCERENREMRNAKQKPSTPQVSRRFYNRQSHSHVRNELMLKYFGLQVALLLIINSECVFNELVI